MSTASIAVSSQLKDKNLNKLVDKITELMKLSAVQAMNSQMNGSVYKFRPSSIKVGRKKTASVPSVASVVAERFNRLDASGKKAARLALGRDTLITSSIRSLSVDMRSAKPITEQLDLKKHFSFINGTTFSKSAVDKMIKEVSAIGSGSDISAEAALKADLKIIASRYGTTVLSAEALARILEAIAKARAAAEAKVNTGLKFRVHEVRCADETNPELWSSDEISWGGAALDDKGVTSKISEYYVGGGFDDGDKKTYSPPKILKTFALDGKNYPKTFMVALSLAEKDEGGFADFIQKLYDAVKAEVLAIIATLGAAAGAYIGAEIGGTVGSAVGGPLGTIIGAVAGAVIGALVGWLISALQDDIFSPEASSIILPKGNCTFDGGSLVSPAMYFHYRDHGGHYTVKYDWEIVR